MDILFPSKGFYPNAAREGQPGNTTPDCLNVLPFDRDFRGRGAPRPGLFRFFSNQLDTGPVQLLRSTAVALAASALGPGSTSQLFTNAPGTTTGVVNAVFNGVFGGHGAFTGGGDHAVFWDNPANPTDLNPVGGSNSSLNSLNAERQVGSADISGVFVAGYWTGTAASWTALPVPGGTNFGSAQGVSPDDSMIVGAIASGLIPNHAVVWQQTLGVWGSPVDLSAMIPSYSSLYSSSSAVASDGINVIVQASLISNSNTVSYMINVGTSTATMLGVDGVTYLYSTGTAINNGVIVGYVQGSDEIQHAALWEVSAPTVMADMTPPGSTTSIINATNGTTHVGLFTTGGNDTAAVWTGVSNAATALSMDPTFVNGYVALAIDSGGEIVGFGLTSSGTTGASWNIIAGGIIPPIQRSVIILAVCNGSIYGGPGDSLELPAATGGASVLSPNFRPQFAARTTKGYLVDTLHDLIQIDLPTMTVETFSPTAGAETATTLGAYSLACMWRDRLVFAASVATPQNFIMSRQGTPTDFDYGQDDSAAAVAGNASKVGSIGEPLNCLMPWTDDILILGGDHSIYKVEGDIAAGGQIVNVSPSIGTLGPDCWDVDPQGNLYFVGTDGLYVMPPGGVPQNLSAGSMRQFFSEINRNEVLVQLSWDRDRNGLYIFVTNISPGGTSTHLWYDATNQAFFPVQYADNVGPVVALIYDGDDPVDRQILLGGRDGYVRQVDQTSLDDDGVDFENYVFIGPVRPGGTDAALAVIQAMEVVVGEVPSTIGSFTSDDWGMNIQLQTGKDAYTALTAPQQTFNFDVTLQARRKRILQRISGGSWYFKISGTAGKLWSLEKLVPLFTPGGLQRRY